GRDTIFGNDGDDLIAGGSGPDTLGGGDGSDRFVFGNDLAVNRITDFTHDLDQLDISGASYDGKGSGLAAAGIVIVQNERDTSIRLHLGPTTETTTVLLSFTASDLDQADFIF